MTIRSGLDRIETPPCESASRTTAEPCVEAQGETATSARGKENGTFRNHVAVPLIGIAERLIGNWRRIFRKIGDAKERKPGFESGYGLALASDGFILPNLVMIPSQGEINLRRKRRKPRYAGIDSLDEREIRVEFEDPEARFRFRLEAARLRSGSSIPDALELEWAKINALDPEERKFRRAPPGAGPFEISNSLAAAAVGCRKNAAPSLRDDASAARSAESPSALSERWARSLQELEGVENGKDRADARRNSPREPSAPPWKQDHDLARSVQHRRRPVRFVRLYGRSFRGNASRRRAACRSVEMNGGTTKPGRDRLRRIACAPTRYGA